MKRLGIKSQFYLHQLINALLSINHLLYLKIAHKNKAKNIHTFVPNDLDLTEILIEVLVEY